MNIACKKKTLYDAVIVGAGPAGCSAAFFASKAGAKILLIDKCCFPRNKTCGDGISPRAMSMLDRMGVAPKVEASSLSKIEGVVVYSPNGTAMESRIPHVNGYRNHGYILQRRILDDILFKHLQSYANVDIIQDCKAAGVAYNGNDVCGIKACCSGTKLDIRAKAIIGADGTHSVIGRQMSLSNVSLHHHAFGIRAYFDGVTGLKNCLEIHYDKTVLPGYGWIFPVGKESANIGIGIMNRFHGNKAIKALFHSFIHNSPVVKERFQSAQMQASSLRGWPIALGSFSGPRGSKNVVLAGDAGSMVDPLTGEGIYTALRSGELAANAFIKCLSSNHKMDQLGSIYERLWKKEFKWQEFKTGYLYQRLLNHEWFVNLAVWRAKRSPRRAEALAGAIIHLLPNRRLFFSI